MGYKTKFYEVMFGSVLLDHFAGYDGDMWYIILPADGGGEPRTVEKYGTKGAAVDRAKTLASNNDRGGVIVHPKYAQSSPTVHLTSRGANELAYLNQMEGGI